jgi:hypothetical protein
MVTGNASGPAGTGYLLRHAIEAERLDGLTDPPVVAEKVADLAQLSLPRDDLAAPWSAPWSPTQPGPGQVVAQRVRAADDPVGGDAVERLGDRPHEVTVAAGGDVGREPVGLQVREQLHHGAGSRTGEAAVEDRVLVGVREGAGGGLLGHGDVAGLAHEAGELVVGDGVPVDPEPVDGDLVGRRQFGSSGSSSAFRW